MASHPWVDEDEMLEELKRFRDWTRKVYGGGPSDYDTPEPEVEDE